MGRAQPIQTMALPIVINGFIISFQVFSVLSVPQWFTLLNPIEVLKG